MEHDGTRYALRMDATRTAGWTTLGTRQEGVWAFGFDPEKPKTPSLLVIPGHRRV